MISKPPSCPRVLAFDAHVKAYQCLSSRPRTLAGRPHSGSGTGVLIRPVGAVLHEVAAEAPGDAAAVPEDGGGAAPPARATGRTRGHWTQFI